MIHSFFVRLGVLVRWCSTKLRFRRRGRLRHKISFVGIFAIILAWGNLSPAQEEPPAREPTVTPTPPPPPPQPTPTPTTSQGTTLSSDEDPNAPNLSRAERIRRQELWLRKRLEAAKQPPDTSKQSKEAVQQRAQREGIPVPAPAPGGLALTKTEQKGKNVWVAKAKTLDDKSGYRKITFFLSPSSVVVPVGETFMTEARLISLDKSAPDRIEVVIQYPPDVLEPVAIHQDRIADLLDGEPDWGMDRALGEIQYKAKLTRPLEGIQTTVLSIVWKALQPAEWVDISLSSGDRFSAAYRGTFLLTENTTGKQGALSGASVRVVEPRNPIPQGERLVSEPIEGFSPALARMGNLGVRPPTLWLDYERQEEYEEGQWVVFDIRLENPDRAIFDDLRLALQFDPESLELSDTDQRNWIHQGVNLLDGPFRDFWDWDIHLKNEIHNATGVIEYRVGATILRRLPSGVLARGFARVKRATKEPLFSWIVSDDEKKEPRTGIYLLGENLFARFGKSEATDEASKPPVVAGKADPAIYRVKK